MSHPTTVRLVSLRLSYLIPKPTARHSFESNLFEFSLTFLFARVFISHFSEVSSSSGLVELKNQFREQNRVLEQERVDKQQTEKRAKAFEQQVETLNAYVKSSLVVAL